MNCSTLPAVHLTQQDFISTFPWGLTGDRVRILMQQTENMLLDAESTAAFAVMLGSPSFSKRLDRAWKTYLNSQNHDIHVCSQEQAGVDWCQVAKPLAEEIRSDASAYIAEKLGTDVTLNLLPRNRKNKDGNLVPAFGYSAKSSPVAPNLIPWTDWFDAKNFSVRISEDGTLEIRYHSEEKRAVVGNLTMEIDGKKLDSRKEAPAIKDAFIDQTSQQAFVTLTGRLGETAYEHRVVITQNYIDYVTYFNYGQTGTHFGPDIKDIELSPRRTHYFQHDRKLCMNFCISEKNAEFLYNSPFLTWPAAKDAHSIESLHYTALQGSDYGLAHMNIGQCAYARDRENSSACHALAFAPNDYIYGQEFQIRIKGKHVHHYRFVPYLGDWRKADLTEASASFNRPLFDSETGLHASEVSAASLVKLRSNTVTASALFERDGKIYIRLVEWAGQEDSIELLYGDEDTVFTETTHSLVPVKQLERHFTMRPWEVKTVCMEGHAVPLSVEEYAPVHSEGIPAGWERQNHFEQKLENIFPPEKDGCLYFVSGYHDGFVRPLEYHTDTMEIEMARTRAYEGYTNSWEIGGSCFMRMHENEPEYLEELKEYLKDGSVEITGGTWCEPFSLIVSGESNIRQLFYGMQTFRDVLDYQVTIYNNQEHATYAQMPQILRSFGLYAVVNRTQWAPYGYESAIDANAANWIGPDGTGIWVIPRYHSMDYDNCPWDNTNLQNGSVTGHNRVWRTEEKFEQMRTEALAHGVSHPLMSMVEDIWAPDLRTTDEELEFYASLPNVKFISFARYLELFGITKENN